MRSDLVKVSKFLGCVLRHAPAMHAGGVVFHRSENGVWLTAAVPPRCHSMPAP